MRSEANAKRAIPMSMCCSWLISEMPTVKLEAKAAKNAEKAKKAKKAQKAKNAKKRETQTAQK